MNRTETRAGRKPFLERCQLGALAAIALLAAGCVRKSVDGDVATFSFELWVPLAVIGVAFVAGTAGWVVRSNSAVWGYGLVVVAVLVLVGIVPGLLRDRVTVDDDHFTLQTGFWFYPTAHDVSFDDLTQITITAEKRRTRRGQRTSYYLNCHRRSGGAAKVPIGDLMKHALDEVLDRADAKGIPVIDQTGA